MIITRKIANKAEDISPLLIGEVIPNSKVINQNGEAIMLNDKIKDKPTVLVFYRGGWCPYCNTQLSALATVEKEVIDLGYQIIAISPDSYENLSSTVNDRQLNYTIYSDSKGTLIQELGIAFTASSATKEYISDKTIGEITEIIPVPAVFVLDPKGKIIFEYLSPDHTKRITSGLLLAVLKNLKYSPQST